MTSSSVTDTAFPLFEFMGNAIAISLAAGKANAWQVLGHSVEVAECERLA
jgi:hypothetical protein